jgi:Domain of unknown function (DUF4331)
LGRNKNKIIKNYLKLTIMVRINKFCTLLVVAIGSVSFASCDKDDNPPADTFNTSGTFTQSDQMARPAINTVFVNAARKNEFNTTIPSAMNAAFNAQFQSVLTGFGYTTNILGWDKATFAGALAADVLNVKTNGTTVFYDGNAANTLSGRGLADDVIDVELTLIFGGSTGASNPTLTKDNVNANDKAFLATFPYLAAPF